MKYRVFIAFMSATLLAGCAGDKLVGRPDMTIVKSDELPPPGREDQILQQRSYLIGPYDVVSIGVYGVPELTRSVQVDASGVISLPLVGQVQAAGSSPAQLADLIAERLRGRYVRDPQVNVNADTVNQMVTVDGEVQKPGLYPVAGRMTLIRAVAKAEGLTAYAQQNFVVVFRKVNNRDMAALYDLRAIRQGIYPDPEIYANDVVLVGESRGSRLFSSIIATAPLLSAPLIAILN